MIISASRRTDIPAFFSDWFFNRLAAGFCLTRNPYKPEQVSRIDLTRPSGIVFWTKNPGPMLPRLSELEAIPYYFQFTLTSYASDIEPHVPQKGTTLFRVFEELSRRIGPNRVIWRYDPVFLNEKYDMEWHMKYFGVIAGKLSGMTRRCVFSFVDDYGNMPKSLRAPNTEEMRLLAKSFLSDAKRHSISLFSCAEEIDLPGVGKSSCIDAALLSRIAGYEISDAKDAAQRKACGCAKSRDIGKYGTCRNGCLYCYAMKGKGEGRYDPDSPLLCDELAPGEKIPEAGSVPKTPRPLWPRLV